MTQESSIVSRIKAIGVLLGAVAMVLSWLVPNHYPPWTSFYNNVCMAAALLLLSVSQPALKSSDGLPSVAVWVLGVTAIPWLQLATGVLFYSGDAWILTLSLVGLAVAVSTGRNWARYDAFRFSNVIGAATLFGACVSAAIGLAQVLLGDVLGVWGHIASSGMRAEANLAQPNNLATLIGFGTVGLLLMYERGQLRDVSAAFVIALLVLGAAATQSRTALLFGPVIVVALLVFGRKQPSKLKIRPHTCMALTLCHWTLTWIWSAIQQILLLAPVPSLADRGLETSRFQAWDIFIHATFDAPWWGWGWLQTATAQFALANRMPPTGELFAEAHNLFLELIVWNGYPTGVLLSLLIIYWFGSRLLKLKSVAGFCGWLTVALLGVHSMLELPYHYAYFLVPAGLWIGFIEGSVDAPTILSHWWRVGATFGGLVLRVATYNE